MPVATAGIAVLGGLAATHFWIKHSNERLDQHFQDSIRADCLTYLLGKFSDSASVRDAIQETLKSAAISPRLKGLVRIECAIEKLSTNECQRALLFLFQPESTEAESLPDLVLGKVARDLNWRDLPRSIRDEFISNANQKIVIILAQTGGTNDSSSL